MIKDYHLFHFCDTEKTSDVLACKYLQDKHIFLDCIPIKFVCHNFVSNTAIFWETCEINVKKDIISKVSMNF